MRKIFFAMMIAAASPGLVIATSVAAEAPASSGFSAETTDLGTLLDNAGAKAVLLKHVPALVNSEQIQMARSLTLKQLQSYAADAVTDEKLAAIQADLDKLAKR